MPEEILSGFGEQVYESSKSVFKAAKQLGVSSFALLVRSLKLRMISKQTYQKLKEQAVNDYAEFLRLEALKKTKLKEKDMSGPSYFLLQLNRNGRLFTQTVLDAFRGGFIEPAIASNLLNVKVNKFQKLETQLFRWTQKQHPIA